MSRGNRPAAADGSRIRIAIVEDHAIVRTGLRMLIENQEGMEVVIEAANASDALKAAGSASADVILLDLDLGGENGLDFLDQILTVFAPARVLVLTATPDTETHLRAVAAGARGVVMKEQAPETLIQAIRSVHSGDAWLGRSLMGSVLGRLSQRGERVEKDPETAKIALLTPREREIVMWVAQGLNGTRAAAQLGISEATVRNHLTSILGKLDLANKFELAVYAFNHGLAEPAKARS